MHAIGTSADMAGPTELFWAATETNGDVTGPTARF